MKSTSAPRGIKNQNSSLSSYFVGGIFFERLKRPLFSPRPPPPHFFFHFLSSLSLSPIKTEEHLTEQLKNQQS